MAKYNDEELGMNRRITRRDFIDGVAVAAAGAAVAAAIPGRAFAGDPGHGAYPPTETGIVGQGPNAFTVGHAVRDGVYAPGAVLDTAESYDLIVVGAGLSGLAAAYFYRKAKPNAKILLLDALPDFGGHAHRNEFEVKHNLMLSNGGTVNVDTPSTWTQSAHDLLVKDLGVDLQALAATRNSSALAPYGLGSAMFFNSERWGTDKLVKRASGEAYNAYVAKMPMSDQAKADLIRLNSTREDYYPGLSDQEKKAILAKTTYEDFLRQKVGIGLDAYDTMKHGTNGLWGVHADRVPAADAWATGQPGFGGLGLDETPWPGAGKTPLMHFAPSGPESGSFAWPDGNASLARMLVSRLVPDVFGGPKDWAEIVTADARYHKIDRDKAPVRIRLNSTVTTVQHNGSPATATKVTVGYSNAGKSYKVTGSNVIMACWNGITSYVVQGLPEEQKTALKYGVKVPLIYTRVALDNWRPFAAAKLSRVSTPTMFWPGGFGLGGAYKIGGYNPPVDPDLPTVVTLTKTPNQPGLPLKQQYKAGRGQMMRTTFADYEREIRDAMVRSLGEYGFDPGRDIKAITVNRWAHGYAYEYTSLDDPSIYLPENQRPNEIGRQRFGRVAIANSDAEAFGYTHAAWNQAYRAVNELL